MVAFLESESGLILSWVLLLLGAADILIGWLWLGRGKGMQEVERELPRFRQWLPLVLLLDGAMILAGLYGLWLHRVI